MSEMFSTIWVWIVGALGGLTLTAIITAIICGVLKGAFSRVVEKINVEKIADKATDKGVERVRKISFSHNIQPLVESELKKVHEENAKILEEEIKELKENNLAVINILDKFACYFDNSMVKQEIKDDLKNEIAKAKQKNAKNEVESIVSNEIVVEDKKVSKKADFEPKNVISVQR